MKKSVKLHAELKGKLSIRPKCEIESMEDMSLIYTPGVADVCREIQKDEKQFAALTGKSNSVAVITNGTAVLGLGDIGVEASMPVMEGKAALFSRFAGLDSIPILVDEKDEDKFISVVKSISKSFGAINLEDISAPSCFKIEKVLDEELDIPVFHDDQHGTAIVTCAGIISAHRYLKEDFTTKKYVICGAGAAGMSITKMLLALGVKEIKVCNSKGLISEKNHRGDVQLEVSKIINPNGLSQTLSECLVGADVFIGVSKGNLLSEEDVKSMNKPIIFAMANPQPEIEPKKAHSAGARIVATGRSDFPNQVNNVLAFPGVIKGALECGARSITPEMKVAAAYAISEVLTDEELSPDNILPDVFNENLHKAVIKSIVEVHNETY